MLESTDSITSSPDTTTPKLEDSSMLMLWRLPDKEFLAITCLLIVKIILLFTLIPMDYAVKLVPYLHGSIAKRVVSNKSILCKKMKR